MYADNQFPKQCGYGASYDEKTWSQLPYAGVFSGMLDSGKRYGKDLEMRNCKCGSTMSVALIEAKPDGWKGLLLIALVVAVFGCGRAWAGNEWTRTDTGLQLTFSALMYIDWHQTQEGTLKSNYKEVGFARYFINERHETRRDIAKYFLCTTLGHAVISYILPQPYRMVWQGIFIKIEYDTIQHNRSVGLSIHF